MKIPHLVQVTVTRNREAPRLAFTKEYHAQVPTLLNVLAEVDAVRARFPQAVQPGDLIQVNCVLHVGQEG